MLLGFCDAHKSFEIYGLAAGFAGAFFSGVEMPMLIRTNFNATRNFSSMRTSLHSS
jgi:hypothetical protein